MGSYCVTGFLPGPFPPQAILPEIEPRVSSLSQESEPVVGLMDSNAPPSAAALAVPPIKFEWVNVSVMFAVLLKGLKMNRLRLNAWSSVGMRRQRRSAEDHVRALGADHQC